MRLLRRDARDALRPFTIAGLAHQAASVVQVDLESSDGRPLTAPLSGQYVEVRLTPAPHATAVVRPYSLCGPASTSRYRLGVKCRPDGVASRYFAERARVGDAVDLSSPRGSFVLAPGVGPLAFIGAGIGVTPLLAMLHELVSERSQRHVWWMYGARDRAEHPFADEVRALLATLPSAHAHVCYSRPGPEDAPGCDFESVGHIDGALIERCGVPPDADCYVCGPDGLLDDVRTALRARGVTEDRIRSEVFASSAEAARGASAAAARSATSAVVSFARSGRSVRWDGTSPTLLDLAESAHVEVQSDCRVGMCHTCETDLISGDVISVRRPVDPAAAGKVLLCCSAPAGNVVLDL